MKKFRLLALALCFIFVLAPLSVFADEADGGEGYDMDPLCLKFETQADYDALITRKEECSAEIVEGDLKLTAKDLGSTNNLNLPDPRIYISYKNLAKKVNAEDYPYITLIYRMPETAQPESSYANGRYFTELFCCTNDTAPRGDQSVRVNPKVTQDKYAFLTFNAGNLSEWQGVITSLRLDFFEWAFEGDVMYVHNIILTNTALDAQLQAKKIVDVLNAPSVMTLKFNVGKYGTAPESQTVKKDEYPTRPQDPTAEGVVFDDWYTSSNFIEKFDFDAPLVKEVTTAYGKWSKVFTVTFDYRMGETPVSVVSVKANDRVDEPAIPSVEGYTFRGWYTEQPYEKYDFSSLVKNNISLYARWEEGVFFPVTVDSGTSSVADAVEGTEVTVTATVPEGMFFDKWVVVEGELSGADLTKAELTFKMPAGRVGLKATFRNVLPGDANGDGSISAKDVIMTMRYMLNPDKVTGTFIFEAADMDQNGKITAKDVIAIMKEMLKK